MTAIAIIGGGCSGVAAAVQLQRRARAHPGVAITLIERAPNIGPGLAYRTTSSALRLNVIAGRMSIDPDAPDEFAKWAGTRDPHAFVPRGVYGAYLTSRFSAAVAAGRGQLRAVRGEAVAVTRDRVVLDNGDSVRAEVVVLATGATARAVPAELAGDPRLVDGWDEAALAQIAAARARRVLVLGSGLTALDVLAYLDEAGFAGEIVLRSRRGLLPRPHADAGAAPFALSPAELATAPAELRGLIRWVRAHVAAAAAAGAPWQIALDALRPHLPALWAALPAADRATFVRAVQPYWDVLRHRAPRELAALVARWRDAGRLTIRAGRIARRDADGCDAIVNCTGLTAIASPLVAKLIADGIATADPLGLGLVTDDHGRVARGIYALGALRRPAHWESTAAPEITRQAAALARTLLP